MKILVTYYSETGNTEKIANAIHEVAVQNHDSHLKEFSRIKVDDLNNYDLVFLGSACHHANLAPPILKFIKEIPDSPNFKLAGFVTHAAYLPEGGEREREIHEKWAGKCIRTFENLKIEKKIDFKGYFSCQGIPSPPIENFIRQKIIPDEDEWEKYLVEVKKHPNITDIENAKKFALEILNQSISSS